MHGSTLNSGAALPTKLLGVDVLGSKFLEDQYTFSLNTNTVLKCPSVTVSVCQWIFFVRRKNE